MDRAEDIRARATEPAPPHDLLAELAQLLERETRAAYAADAELLLSLQTEKGEVLRAIEVSASPDPAGLARLAEKARANLPLVRALVALHRALVGEARESTYGVHGVVAAPPPPPRLSRSG